MGPYNKISNQKGCSTYNQGIHIDKIPFGPMGGKSYGGFMFFRQIVDPNPGPGAWGRAREAKMGQIF